MTDWNLSAAFRKAALQSSIAVVDVAFAIRNVAAGNPIGGFAWGLAGVYTGYKAMHDFADGLEQPRAEAKPAPSPNL